MEILSTIAMFLGVCMLIPFAIVALVISAPFILWFLSIIVVLFLGILEFIVTLVRGYKK